MIRKSAFTLIELLVAIAIILIVAAIALPVFTAARRQAHKTVCVSNMRQTYLAMSLYYSDNDDWTFPIPGLDVLLPYSGSKLIFECPEDHYVKKQAAGYPVKLGFNWNGNNQRFVDYRISYAFIGDYDEKADFWGVVQDKSPIGVLACQWHGEVIDPFPGSLTYMNPPLGGQILRIVFDGHLYRRPEREYRIPFSVPDMFYLPFRRTGTGGLK